jgi:predicted ArsR family transcriptional regulator
LLNDLGGLAELAADQTDDDQAGLAIVGYRCPFAEALPEHAVVCRLAEQLIADASGLRVTEQCARDAAGVLCRMELRPAASPAS